MTTTTDQDRRIEDRAIELGAARARVIPTPRSVRPCWNCGGSGSGCCEYAADPDSTSRVVTVDYRDAGGRLLDVEVLTGDGIPHDPEPDELRGLLGTLLVGAVSATR